MAEDAPMETVDAEVAIPVDPMLELAHLRFALKRPDLPVKEKNRLQEELKTAVINGAKTPLYKLFVEEFGWELHAKQLEELEQKNATDLQAIEDKIKDAEENLGDTEVREALLAKAEYFVNIGDKDKALAALQVTEDKTVAVGQKMDLVFTVLRVGLFWMDFPLIRRNIEKAKSLFEEGGDWERKNRLKVYEGLYAMAIRDFKKAAGLYLDSVSTFTSYELFPYNTFAFYTVITSIISLDRVSLKKKVIDAPEILAVISSIPHLGDFMNSLYFCKYHQFYRSLIEITEAIKADRYLRPHVRYFMREVRVVAYSQFLQSYKSVTLASMAAAFGVTVDFLDNELSTFIASGRLNCKIDKVGGVLETNRPDAKNALYQNTIKQGDLLLNRVQKLSRVIHL
eukprot:jgi/Chlat1/3872/Chrsp26S04015